MMYILTSWLMLDDPGKKNSEVRSSGQIKKKERNFSPFFPKDCPSEELQ